MTENPNDTLCSTQFYNQIKRELTNSPCTNDVALGFYNGNNVDSTTSQLTESNLKYNVHIVLENLKRSAEKTYLYDNANNNNSNHHHQHHHYNSSSNSKNNNNNNHISSSNIVGNQNEKIANTISNSQSNLKNARNSFAGKMSSPESDCNSNVHANPIQQLASSIASSHDFTHDNSDYQWFLDYNYRENNVTHQSVLSSLSASYNGIGELSYYDDLAKNIDANLAGVDMESFRAEDINLLLSTIPNMCKSNAKKQQEKELDNSIFKSKQLFSPVKESILSVDSLDMDCYAEDCDMIITCQANKNNYTIAFEGSTMYSDESFYADANKDMLKKKTDANDIGTNIDDIVKKKALEVSLYRSESGFTTWSKLKKDSSTQLHRYPSGNNNTSVNVGGIRHCMNNMHVRKSSSLPNLQIDQDEPKNNLRCDAVSNSTIDSLGKPRILPMCQIVDSSSQSDSPLPLQASSSSNEPQQNQPSFNLVKLFIKQKSSSTDTCMDVSSGCWPSDSSSSVENRQRKKSMYDSGKGSALSKHEEDTHGAEIQYDSLDLPQQPTKANDNTNSPKRNSTQSNDLYREVFDSPSHRKYKEFNLNIRNQHLANVNNNNSMDRDSLRETIKSISDASRTSDNITQVYAKTKLPLDMITKSMQTSKIDEGIKIVPPSFLAQLNHSSKTNEQQQAPVYVIYPNYALPDLTFVKTYQSQIILSPLGLKETLVKKQRPLSTNDIEYIKKKDYNHIVDWKSLAPLLPFEYKRILQHIPEVQNVMNDPKLSQKPMFCMSPPIRRSRPMSCDCTSYCTDSSTGSSQPPSSGYRGSSTMLTDSEIDALSTTNSGNNNRIVDEHSELPPSGSFMRRGILRRANSSTKSKRNSMTDETATTPSSATVRHRMEKRCSVQDPYYAPEAFNTQYYPYCGNIFDVNRLKNNLRSEKTKEQMTIEHKEYDDEARSRVEQFLSSVPKSELKYYAEIANVLESIDSISDIYDRNKLKDEVSRALAQKHVSFDRDSCQYLAVNNNDVRNSRAMTGRGFTTPPNSPNISILRGNIEQQQKSAKKSKQEKIQSNRFKRLQIQWELLSKDAQQMERELFKETRSGGNTPTATTQCMVPRSKIPRPVSYPASKSSATAASKSSPSPSRIATPKKVNIAPSTTPVSRPRTPSKLYNTPKKTSPIIKTGTRVK
ncbi:myb-like protein A isoform X3 [Sitodiplosis mosellana]|nr:myb-like protein A isoform X3 [Sitodiplosis mosellana]